MQAFCKVFFRFFTIVSIFQRSLSGGAAGIFYRKRLKNRPYVLLAERFLHKSVLLAIHFFRKSVVYIKHFFVILQRISLFNQQSEQL